MRILIIVLCILTPLHLAGQVVTGVVKDSRTGDPLSYANITIPGTFKGTYTDGRGRFSLSGLGKEKVAIRISFIGYRSQLVEALPGVTGELSVALARSSVMADEVVISATRATAHSGMAYTEYSREEIDRENYGQDMPYMLAASPSAVVTSDAGTGIGYTGIRIRGTDASRINVTINGVPLNDAESQLVYWVDLPDLAASTDNIQVQRGVGTSTNGAGAFGGSIHVQTNKLIPEPYLRTDHTAGAFGTIKNSISAGTGLLHDHWTFDIRLSRLNSDGYVDRAGADLKSLFISQGYYADKAMIRLNIITGKEVTYQSWYGTPQAVIEGDVQGMIDYSVRNGLDSEDSLNLLTSGRTYNYYQYHNQVDDYQQDHYQLHMSFEPAEKVVINSSLHYTRGRGFFEEYRKNQLLSDYGVVDSVPGFVFGPVSLVRRKWLDNDFYGATFSLHVTPSGPVSLIAGGAWNKYLGDHYDEVIWAEFLPVDAIPFGYAFDTGDKTDFNAFVRTVIDVHSNVSLYADLQGRRVSYLFTGPGPGGGASAQGEALTFFNPKAGITVRPDDRQTWHASLAMGNKEPSRNDYTDSPYDRRPVAERLYDFEAGYRFRIARFTGALNFYHMRYDNQLVLNGSLNDVGEPIRVNVKESYRQGIEAEWAWKPVRKVRMSGSVTLGRTNIKSYNEIVADYDTFVNDTITYANTSIAYSPDVIAFTEVAWSPIKRLELALNAKYVGRQFLDNTSDESRSIDAYWYSGVRLGYTFKTKFVDEVRLGLQVKNIFDRLYESNGYTYSYIYGGETITENFYYPQAGRHVMGRLTLVF